MKKLIPFFTVILCLSAILLSSVLCSFALTEHSPAVYVIDEVRFPAEWNAVGAFVSKAIYTDETRYLSAGEGDDGYIIVKKDNALSNEPVSASRVFDSPINLYSYSAVKLNLSIEVPDAAYSVTVTLYSGEHEYTHTAAVTNSDWQEIVIPVDDWDYRSRWTGIKVSVTASYEGVASMPVLYRLDNIVAEGAADTLLEDTFMTDGFSVAGGSCNYISASNAVRFHHSTSASLSGVAVYESLDSVADHNTLRAVLSAGTPTELKLLLTYADGSGYISESVTVSSDTPRTFYFSYPNAAEVSSFTFSVSSETSGLLMIYGIDTYYLPASDTDNNGNEEDIGTLDVCTLDSSGSINLRGTISTDTVVSHLDGEIAVYAIPLYADEDEYLASAAPLVTVDMTTRYNITIERTRLPEGVAAHRYVVLIEDDDKKLMIDAPRLPAPDDTGVSIPLRSRSLKGLSHANVTSGQSVALTQITVDLTKLFGELSSGRIYSAFGKLYYFDSEYLKGLDSDIRSLSLSGTDVYIRLVVTDGDTYNAVTADSQDEFETLYTAADFLTQRYSSADYGYICGIIAGHDEHDLRDVGDPASVSLSIAKAAAVIYGAGMSNINDFRVLLPFGDKLITADAGDIPNELLLRFTAQYAADLGLYSYGVIWQTSSIESDSLFRIGIDGADILKQFTTSLYGTSPSVLFMEYSPDSSHITTSAALLADYIKTYYTVCGSLSASGFIYDTDIEVSEGVWNEFIAHYKLIDTDKHADAEESALPSDGTELPVLSDSAKNRAHPYTYTVTPTAYTKPTDMIGSFELFGYSESFDTGGWFSVDEGGECITVKAESGRAMRAVGGGIMYSSASSPIDLSSAPVISIDASTQAVGEYEFIVFSGTGVISSTVRIDGDVTAYVDLSSLQGLDAVTGMMLLPKSDEANTLYINGISIHSKEKTDGELCELYLAASISDYEDRQPEENIVTIVAVIFLALIMTAAAFLLMRRQDR